MKREEQNELSKEKILKACIEEFGKNDYVSASLNNICKNNNISKGLLFHYYKNKDELFLLCVKKCFDDLSIYLEENIEIENHTVEEKINNYFSKRTEFFRKHSYYNQIFISAVFNTPEHEVDNVMLLKKGLIDTNIRIFNRIFEGESLKNGIDKEKAIDVILELSTYMQLKFKSSYKEGSLEDGKIISELDKSFINMLNMILYGILK